MKALIKGTNKINGTVKISGAKNSATRLLAASLICDTPVRLINYPLLLLDSVEMVNYLKNADVNFKTDNSNDAIEIDAGNLTGDSLNSYHLPVRITYLLAAGILKKDGVARIPYPGGCKIGNRGYDLHIRVWENMGCIVEEKNDHIYIKIKDRLKPINFQFPISTIGGTENALICASIIPGESHIRNAYISPEIFDLISFLRAAGVKIDVTGNSFIKVNGSENLKGVNFTVMPDRIEALTWMILAGITKGTILLRNVPFDSMEAPMMHLKEAGLDIFRNTSDAYISPESLVNGVIQPFELACGTYPGVISDMQPFFVLLALKADGISRIYDYRYPERTGYLSELSKICPGAIKWEKGRIEINGKASFSANQVTSTDLRGSMALIMAAVLAEGKTKIDKVEIALRGYNDLETKLKNLGVEMIIKN